MSCPYLHLHCLPFSHTPADSVASDQSSSDSEDGQSDSLLARVYSKRSLTHFDTLWTLTLSQDDNLDYFLHTHYKVRLWRMSLYLLMHALSWSPWSYASTALGVGPSKLIQCIMYIELSSPTKHLACSCWWLLIWRNKPLKCCKCMMKSFHKE